jgi:hypothetical protein
MIYVHSLHIITYFPLMTKKHIDRELRYLHTENRRNLVLRVPKFMRDGLQWVKS